MFHRLARVNLRRLSRDDALRRLGLEDGEFTSTQLKNAYLEKAKEFHPDSNKTEADRFHAIKEAYDFLQARFQHSFLVYQFRLSQILYTIDPSLET